MNLNGFREKQKQQPTTNHPTNQPTSQPANQPIDNLCKSNQTKSKFDWKNKTGEN